MNKKIVKSASGQPRSSKVRALFAAFALTLMAAPVHASLEIPNVPLQSGTAVPPNIWFILDDSGSMDWVAMPENRTSLSDVPSQRSAARNSIYYDPARIYRPWRNADGTLMANTPASAAFSSTSRASGNTTNLTSSVQTFFVLNAGATDLTANASYTKYVLSNATSAQRCPWNGTAFNCQTITAFPWGRSIAEEWANFANWYSFHRTRIKAAKAGTSYAFSELSPSHRVGFTTIWNRNTFDIPVGTTDGRFEGANRTTWFNRLFNADAGGLTPLHDALDRAGQYFQQTGTSGPWGPESGDNQLQCRQNFTILTTDGFWNSRNTSFGNVDNSTGPAITGPNGASYQYQPARPYLDSHTNTLADVAMHYWNRDLRPDMVNAVPTTPGNPAFWQHMVTFGISIGLRGNLNPETDYDRLAAGTINWPNPNDAEDADRIDDLWHATVNSRGQFIAASDPDAFTEGLRDALSAISERVGSGSNVAANSVALREETRIFQASYVGGRWSGELASYPITAAGVSATPSWRASDPGKIPSATLRRLSVFTHDGNSGRNFYDYQINRTNGLGTIGGFSVLNYLLGDASGEQSNNGPLRERYSPLGDIVNSSPAFSAQTEPAAIFVGANDGMLHAFDAVTGDELFAYVPGAISTDTTHRLRKLADPDYAHEFFVDGPVTVSTRVATPGRNILVGTLGRGGRGLFALDVTEPDDFVATDVLWDTISTNNTWNTSAANGDPRADLGMILNQPIIARTNGRTGNQNSDLRPAMVVFGNGVNSASGRASLMFVDAATGNLVRNVRLGNNTNNGVTSIRAWDEDGDGLIDYVFAADLRGDIWKIDIDYFGVANWGVADGGQIQGQLRRSSGGNPLISTGRPITGGLQVAFDPVSYDRWLFFGTGKYLEQSDITSTNQERWYGVKDTGVSITNIASDLTEREIIVASAIDGTPVRGFEPHAALPPDSLGWFVDLQAPDGDAPPSERMVSDSLMVGRVLVAASILPSSDPCESGGTGYLNAIDAFTGTSVQAPFFDVNGDGSFDDDVIGFGGGSIPVGSVNLGVAMPTSPTVVENLLVVGGSLGTMNSIGINNPLMKGRVSWREILGD